MDSESSLQSSLSSSTTSIKPISTPTSITTVAARTEPITPIAVPVMALIFFSPDHDFALLSRPPGFQFPPPPLVSSWNTSVLWPYNNTGSSSSQPPASFMDPLQTPAPPSSVYQPLKGPASNVWSLNVTNFVTTTLSSLDDFLSWKTQFIAFLISHQLMGFVDVSSPAPSPFVTDQFGVQQHNPAYGLWIRYDLVIRSWLLATLSRDNLTETKAAARS